MDKQPNARDLIQNHLRRSLSSARAAKGWKWTDVAFEAKRRGWKITAGNLMTRHSRMSFRADELLMLMSILEMDFISLPGGNRGR